MFVKVFKISYFEYHLSDFRPSKLENHQEARFWGSNHYRRHLICFAISCWK